MSLPWSPSPADEPELLNQISLGATPFGDLASRYSTTVPALCAWINHPDTELKLRNIETAITRCARLSATNLLPAIVQTAKAMLDEWNEDLAHAPVTHPEPASAFSPRHPLTPSPRHQRIPVSLLNLSTRARAREGARRICNLILRLARFYPAASAPSSPGPAGGGVTRAASDGGGLALPSPTPSPAHFRPPSTPTDSLESLIALASSVLGALPTEDVSTSSLQDSGPASGSPHPITPPPSHPAINPSPATPSINHPVTSPSASSDPSAFLPPDSGLQDSGLHSPAPIAQDPLETPPAPACQPRSDHPP